MNAIRLIPAAIERWPCRGRGHLVTVRATFEYGACGMRVHGIPA